MTSLEIQTLEAVKSASRALVKDIDGARNLNRIWEQRRYEIAKDMFVHYSTMTAQDAVSEADKLISELRKPTE